MAARTAARQIFGDDTAWRNISTYQYLLRQVNGYRARKALCGRVENLFLMADDDCSKVVVV